MVPNGQIVSVTHFSFIQWHVHVEAFASPTAYIVKITFTKVGPKCAVLVTMNRKVQDSKYIPKTEP